VGCRRRPALTASCRRSVSPPFLAGALLRQHGGTSQSWPGDSPPVRCSHPNRAIIPKGQTSRRPPSRPIEQSCNSSFSIIERSLAAYLESKKLLFPRFFFLSNDELIEILSEAKEPLRIQPFAKKIIEAVKSVGFGGQSAR
jgi:hypothetical protein